MITVKDVWRSALPPHTELVGGGAGLERRVEWATSLRTRPPAFEAIKGGEMAFIAVRSIKLLDERLDLTRVLDSFAEKGGVAAAVIGGIPADAIGLADRLMLPLLLLPEQVHLPDVQQATIRFILDQRTTLHDRAQELQTELMELALGGAGPVGIVERLAELLNLPVAWQDDEGQVRHAAGAALPGAGIDPWSTEIAAIRRFADSTAVLAADPPVREFPVGRQGVAKLVAPIPLRSGIGGFISVLGAEADLGQLVRLGCARAASACAIELDRERAVLAARDDLEGEFVAALLSGSYSSETAMLDRARRFGSPIGDETLVMVVRASAPGPADDSQGWPESGVRTVQRWAKRRELPVLVAAHQNSAAVIVGTDLSDPRRAALEIAADCRSAAGGADVAVGIGRTKHGLGGIRASHREAEQAIGMGLRLYGPAAVVSFADLGLNRLLYSMAQHPELHDFYRDSLGSLIAYDEKGSGDLLRTLDAFFVCHGSPTGTAQRLKLHRNTVLYRLRRIEEVGKVNLGDAATRLNLQLCLRIRDVLQAAG